jgi:hypothetical protein
MSKQQDLTIYAKYFFFALMANLKTKNKIEEESMNKY